MSNIKKIGLLLHLAIMDKELKMPKFFVTKQQIENQVMITGEDAKHIKTVLRMKEGEKLTVCDGEGMDYICSIRCIEKDGIFVDVLEKYFCEAEPSVKITLFQGLPKADKMEFIIQKCIEIGVDYIVPVATEHSIVKLDKKEQKKLERWQKIAEAAAKQSGRGKIVKIGKVLSFQEALQECQKLDSAIIPYEKEQQRTLKEFIKEVKGKTIGVLIGPEGGFSTEEITQAIEYNVLPVTLGKRILRTETAGMVTTAILIYELENIT